MSEKIYRCQMDDCEEDAVVEIFWQLTPKKIRSRILCGAHAAYAEALAKALGVEIAELPYSRVKHR